MTNRWCDFECPSSPSWIQGCIVGDRRVDVENVISVIQRDRWSGMPAPVSAIIRHEIAYVVRASAIAADEDVRLCDWDRSRSIREPVGVDRAARNRQPAGWCIRLGIGIRYGGMVKAPSDNPPRRADFRPAL